VEKHVDYVLNQITKKASDNKRNKDANVKPQHVKDKLFDPEEHPQPHIQRSDQGVLDMPVTKFQRKIEVSDKFVEDLLKNTDITK
jgi:hypothetical protein